MITMSINNNLAERIAEMFLGVPYKHRGRDFSGLDCLGLVLLFYSKFGLKFPDYEYSEEWKKNGEGKFLEEIPKFFIKVNKPKSLDLVVFKNCFGQAVHIGVMINRFGRFIHCTKNGVSIDRIFHYSGKIEGFYRPKELADG